MYFEFLLFHQFNSNPKKSSNLSPPLAPGGTGPHSPTSVLTSVLSVHKLWEFPGLSRDKLLFKISCHPKNLKGHHHAVILAFGTKLDEKCSDSKWMHQFVETATNTQVVFLEETISFKRPQKPPLAVCVCGISLGEASSSGAPSISFIVLSQNSSTLELLVSTVSVYWQPLPLFIFRRFQISDFWFDVQMTAWNTEWFFL